MKRILGIALIAVVIIVLFSYYPLNENKGETPTSNQTLSGINSSSDYPSYGGNEKHPTVNQILSRLNSYQSFCWEVEGNQLEIYFLTVHARKIRSCIDYSNNSAVLWVEREDGGNFTYRVSSQTNDMDWSAIVNAIWPETNIMNFLERVLKNGNVTGIHKENSYYRFRIVFKQEEVSNAGTIENPHIIRAVETWNVTLVVKENGEPVSGRFHGEFIGGSAGVPPVHEGNFTILTARP